MSLEVRSDNIAALTLLLNLKGSSKALNRVGRELAFVMHTLGWHRLLQTCCLGNSATLSELKDVPEISPATRDTSWWTTAEAIWSNQGLSSPLVLVRAPCDVLCSSLHQLRLSYAARVLLVFSKCWKYVVCGHGLVSVAVLHGLVSGTVITAFCRGHFQCCSQMVLSRPCVGCFHGLVSVVFTALCRWVSCLVSVVVSASCRFHSLGLVSVTYSRPCVGSCHSLVSV